MIIRDLAMVFLGGGMGCVGRYAISLWIKKYATGIPIHTLVANMVGCIIIGLVMGILAKHPNQVVSLLLITGFCGGFTTFSTFSLESLNLLRSGAVGMGLFYMGLSLVACVLMVMFGGWIGSKI